MNQHAKRISRRAVPGLLVISAGALVAACGRGQRSKRAADAAPPLAVTTYTVRDTTIAAMYQAAGVAQPVQQAILGTKLMGTVTEVLVREGDRVSPGQALVRIDARDLSARSSQAAASVSAADAVYQEALTQARRIRALYADSAATRAQLDAAETGLARADAAARAARAAQAELAAVSSYSVVRAPFAGTVTRRFVDAGAFAAPGAPLVAVQDASRLRITASTTPDIAQHLRRGQRIAARIEGRPARAVIEGIVPAGAGTLYTVNALVSNADGGWLAGSAATLALPAGKRTVLVVPAAAVTRVGDLTGVMLRTAQGGEGGDERRWVRLGAAASGEVVEVTAGLRPGDRVVVPSRQLIGATAGN